ncbi:MAG: hypothetical protein AB1758_34140 [Candidatus Eremiobacterota bacterium]
MLGRTIQELEASSFFAQFGLTRLDGNYAPEGKLRDLIRLRVQETTGEISEMSLWISRRLVEHRANGVWAQSIASSFLDLVDPEILPHFPGGWAWPPAAASLPLASFRLTVTSSEDSLTLTVLGQGQRKRRWGLFGS